MTSASTARTAQVPVSTKTKPYASHQRFDIAGATFQLTFVRSSDSTRPASYKSQDKKTMHLPTDLLESYRDKVNFFNVQGYTAVHVQSEGVDSWGVSFCSHSEPLGYSRAKGQRKALDGALRSLPTMSKEVRKTIWAKYNEQNPIPHEQRSEVQEMLNISEALVFGALGVLRIQRTVKATVRRIRHPALRNAVRMIAQTGL